MPKRKHHHPDTDKRERYFLAILNGLLAQGKRPPHLTAEIRQLVAKAREIASIAIGGKP